MKEGPGFREVEDMEKQAEAMLDQPHMAGEKLSSQTRSETHEFRDTGETNITKGLAEQENQKRTEQKEQGQTKLAEIEKMNFPTEFVASANNAGDLNLSEEQKDYFAEAAKKLVYDTFGLDWENQVKTLKVLVREEEKETKASQRMSGFDGAKPEYETDQSCDFLVVKNDGQEMNIGSWSRDEEGHEYLESATAE